MTMYCWNCFSVMGRRGDKWVCPKCRTSLGMGGEEYELEEETKADRTRNLSDETLAELFFEICRDKKMRKKSKKEWLQWLKSPLDD